MMLTMFLDILNLDLNNSLQTSRVEASELGGFSPSSVDIQLSNNRWKTSGGKNYPLATGRQLVYDVFDDGGGKKTGGLELRDFGRGRQNYFTFEGWSAIIGHMHHRKGNQTTHIVLKNKKNGQEKIYNTYQREWHASKDVEWNRLTNSPTSIRNACAEHIRNTDMAVCNMWYEHVGFKAFIPMDELFPEGVEDGTEWEMYLVKRVGNNILHEGLRVPFQINDFKYREGKISFSSGIDATNLTMIGNRTLRRPGKGKSVAQGTYFRQGQVYKKVDYDQSGTAVWYGVVSPHDGNQTRWTSSPQWRFGGNIATLKYTADTGTCPDGTIKKPGVECDVIVTIYHKDKETSEELLKEQFKLKEGTKYHYVPKPDGYFKKGDEEYYASPAVQEYTGKATKNLTFTFTYSRELIPPTDGEQPGATPGSSGGDVNWRLYKPDTDGISKMKAENSMVITRTHYAIEEDSIKNTTIGRSFVKETEGPHVVTGIDADVEKGGVIKYKFEYVYTDYYKNVCTGYNSEGRCTGYKEVPDWSKKVKYEDEHTLSVDHKRGEFFDLGVSGTMVNESIGWSKDTETEVTNNQRERLTVPSTGREKVTKTQVAIPIMESPYKYSNDFREGFHHVEKEQVDRFYWVKEVDNNLKNKYRNRTSRNYQDYAIPVEIDTSRISSSGGEYTVPVVSRDDFYTTRGTGFVFSVPRGATIGEVNTTVQSEYRAYTGANYRDSVVGLSNLEKSMYYMPIDGNAEMKEKTKYTHPLIMGRMGLNDVTVKHDVNVSFQHYLVGNVFDETWVVEQNDPIVDVTEYPHSVTISQEDGRRIKNLQRTDYIHSFRSTDGVDFYDTIKGILGF